MSNKTVYLKDYQPPVFSIEALTLDVSLYESHATVKSQLRITRKNNEPLHLFGEELELVSIHVNEQELKDGEYSLSDDALIIRSCPRTCVLSIETKIYPQKNTALSGLYRSNSLFCTQCEAEGFRRITFFPDRPDVLTVYTTKISADKHKYPVMLSNGNCIDSGEESDGRHWVVWHDPFKKPSYLFALVAGQLACVNDQFITCSGRKVDLRMYVEPGNETQCSHAMASLKKAMRWDEEKFGREYDLDIFMIVAVSDFNMGAMENKGLNIFNDNCLLVSPETATDQDYAWVEQVVSHEYFHNWTGNRVTCRDWFQLSLKEGLTVFREHSFVEDMNSQALCRIQEVNTLRRSQFVEDAGKMAHPVQPSAYQRIDNFYTATIYEKGSEVIRMQASLLGQEGFRRGMDLYFERHDGQAVTIDDFVAAMEDANGVDFTQLKRWYHQAGTPRVKAKTRYNDGRLSITLSQSCPQTPDGHDKEPFHIPIDMALWDANMPQQPLDERILSLTEPTQEFHIDGLDKKPVVSLLRSFSAPVILEFEQSDEELITLMQVETDGFSQWEAGQHLVRRCLLALYHGESHEKAIPQALLETYRNILEDESLEGGFRASLLTPPTFEDIVLALTAVDVDRAVAACDTFFKTLAHALSQRAQSMYHQLWEKETHAVSQKAFHQRSLRNACLKIMMESSPESSMAICQQQYRVAGTMTDKLASLELLANCPDDSVREDALQHFYQEWDGFPRVLDKWFAAQAKSSLPGTLDRVVSLVDHNAFNLSNPNRVYALIRTFCAQNPRYFHAKDGRGYQFLANTILALDALNPLVAARLAKLFSLWQELDESRQVLIQKELAELLTHPLSADLREVIEKSAMTKHA